MSDQHVSAERKLAMMKMQEALKLAEGRHPERGVEKMHEVLEIDPKFIDARIWLARFYLANDNKHMAVSQFEEILRIDPDNQVARAKLREADPVTAERIERLQRIAPDPFVAERAKVDMSDLDDFDEGDEEHAEDDGTGAPFSSDRAGTAVFVEEGQGEAVYYEPLPWEHDQEREYRDKLDQSDAFVRLLCGYAELWCDEDVCGRLLAGCLEPENAGFKDLRALNEEACAALGAEATRLLVADGWLRTPVTLPVGNGTVIVGGDIREINTGPEVKFWLAWACHNLLSGAAEYIWSCEQVLSHSGQVPDIAVAINAMAAGHIRGWDEGLDEEARKELIRDCQAWEMRAVLSADRGGLLGVGEEAVVRRAIASAAVDRKHAAEVTSTQFLGIFRAKQPAELARIGVQANPWLDPQYAAYRSHVIRWWATTDQYKGLAAGAEG